MKLLLCVCLAMSMLWNYSFADRLADLSVSTEEGVAFDRDEPDPNTPSEPPDETVSQDPNQPAIFVESTDIEELITESKATIDQDVLQEDQKQKEQETTVEDVPPVTKELETAKVIPDSNQIETAETDSDFVEDLLQETRSPIIGWFEDKVVQKALLPYTNFKQYLYDKYRISLATEQLLIYQRATGGRDPHEQSVYNFQLFGLWELSADETEDRGVVGFLFEERDNVTDWNVEDFSREVGSTFRTHTLNSKERSRTALRQLWWRKRFVDEAVTLTIGKLHHSSYYNRNAYAGSSRSQFFSAPFARNPNRLLPQDGLGVNIKLKPNDDYYLSVGFGDARSNVKTSGFDTFQEGDFVEMAEIGFTPKDGNYRFTYWHTDETIIDDIISEEGSGLAFSFDRKLNQKVGVFGRYGFAESQVDEMTNFISTGFVFQDPWGIKGDLFGCGLSWDENSDTDEDEFAIEVFHRMQTTKMLQLTPSILVIFDPTRSEKTDPVAVFGFRARVLF
jgi:hypothetical protein